MGMWKAAFTGFALAVATLGLSGCGSSDDDKNYVEQPVEVLYNRALDDLGAQEYKAAAKGFEEVDRQHPYSCLLYTSPSPRDRTRSRMPSSA